MKANEGWFWEEGYNDERITIECGALSDIPPESIPAPFAVAKSSLATTPKRMRHGWPEVRVSARFENVPVPDIQPDEILVKVTVCGMCRSDVQLVDGYEIR